MELRCKDTVFGVFTQEHMIKNDFYLRLIEISGSEEIDHLCFSLFSGSTLCCRRSYDRQQILEKLAYSAQELRRYRKSSLYRILGRDTVPDRAIMHEYFNVYTFEQVDLCVIEISGPGYCVQKKVSVLEYHSQNSYQFPMDGAFLVSDTYPSINSHRWCRNSEFAMDIGAFSRDLTEPVISGKKVYSACDGEVVEVFDGLEDSDETTDFDEIERRFGEPARVDGNHVLIRHRNNEFTLYSHLQKGSVCVRPGDYVDPSVCIGKVGSSGSSALPHLHFHAMKEGISGPGIPITFTDATSFFGEPSALDETTNIVCKQPR